MNKEDTEDLLLMGKVLRPHGLGGHLKVSSYARSEASFLNAGKVLVRTRAGCLSERAVRSVQPHKGAFIMKLEGIDTVEEAEACRGAAVLVRKEAFSRESEDEFFWHEIIGLEVYLNTGAYVGEVRHILPTGGNDLYVVSSGKSEVLIPAVHELVREIDLANRRIIVSDVEGLLELNEA
ncbi:MAG: ribosome maturation factor RimM [Thermodesulfobacteriota bacterium]